MTKDDLKKILDDHALWLRGEGGARANLREADLRWANLWSTVGNGGEVKSLHCGGYDVAFTHDVLQIGCKRYPIKDWFEFDDETISSMDGGALEWWRKWRPILKQIVEVA